MHWLQALDTGLFDFINQSLANPVFDWLMPVLSGNAFFFPVLFLLGISACFGKATSACGFAFCCWW